MDITVTPPKEPVYDVQLKLTQTELNVLVELCGRVGGPPSTIARSTTDKLCLALSKFETDDSCEYNSVDKFFSGSLAALNKGTK